MPKLTSFTSSAGHPLSELAPADIDLSELIENLAIIPADKQSLAVAFSEAKGLGDVYEKPLSDLTKDGNWAFRIVILGKEYEIGPFHNMRIAQLFSNEFSRQLGFTEQYKVKPDRINAANIVQIVSDFIANTKDPERTGGLSNHGLPHKAA